MPISLPSPRRRESCPIPPLHHRRLAWCTQKTNRTKTSNVITKNMNKVMLMVNLSLLSDHKKHVPQVYIPCSSGLFFKNQRDHYRYDAGCGRNLGEWLQILVSSLLQYWVHQNPQESEDSTTIRLHQQLRCWCFCSSLAVFLLKLFLWSTHIYSPHCVTHWQ